MSDIAVNPGPSMGLFNARSMRNKGTIIADAMVSYKLDLLCLTETHIRLSDTDGLLKSLTPVDCVLLHRPRLSGKGGGVGYIIKENLLPKVIDSTTYNTFEHMVISVSVSGSKLLIACVYRPPGSCSSTFLNEFMSFVGFLTSIDCRFCICGDFNIHVDVPGGEGVKFTSLLESCNISQLVHQPTHLHGHMLDLILSPSDQPTVQNWKFYIKCSFYELHTYHRYSMLLSCN